jgi:hypothetical protein
VERSQTDVRISAKANGPPATNIPNLDTKKDRGSIIIYARSVRIFVPIKDIAYLRGLWDC